MALKTYEVDSDGHSDTKTKVVLFDLEGRYEVIDELPGVKYEGLEFL